MKKSLTKKLFLSILTVAFAVVCLGTTTFAWFTISSTATVDPFEAQVKSGEGFEIAVTNVGGTPTTWYTGSVPATAVTTAIAANTTAFNNFDAVTLLSVTDTLTFKKISVDYSTKIATDATTNATTAEYVAFDLHFRLSDSADANSYNVNLTSYELKANADSQKAWTCDQAFNDGNGSAIAVGDSVTYDVSNAARILLSGSKKIVLEKAASSDTKSGEKVTIVGNTLGMPTENGAYTYFKLKNNLTTLTKTATYAAVNAATTATELTTALTKNGVQKLTVYVWIEGWDAECMNPIFGQQLSTSLTFGLSKKAQA